MERRAKESGRRRRQIITIYVNNIAEKIHWKGLWLAFSRHGEEVFSSVRPWSEAESKTYKATWVEITGVPLHCWNGTTFRRLAQLWGDFEAFGENLDCSVNFEKMKVLISTNQD
ncbi:hypothetical protein V6N13_124432 [Hibiscus sabdariffa]